MLLTPDASSVVAVAAAGGAALALVGALVANLRAGRVRKAYAAMLGDAHPGDVVDVVGAHVESVAQLREEVSDTQNRMRRLSADLAQAVRHVAVVRYDAFGDMGGRLSFSVALLDDSGDGLVISSINGRTETRSYAKGVKDCTSENELSPEEVEAVKFAMEGAPKRRPKAPVAPDRRARSQSPTG